MLRVKEEGDLLRLGIKPSSQSKEVLADMCDYHIKLDEIDETLVIYLLKPVSRIMHVTYDYSKGYPVVKLTPVV